MYPRHSSYTTMQTLESRIAHLQLHRQADSVAQPSFKLLDLPLELIDAILSQLPTSESRSATSQTCKLLHDEVDRHLFSDIELGSRHAFFRFLEATRSKPTRLLLVRRYALRFHFLDGVRIDGAVHLMRRMANLESLSVSLPRDFAPSRHSRRGVPELEMRMAAAFFGQASLYRGVDRGTESGPARGNALAKLRCCMSSMSRPKTVPRARGLC